MSPLVRLQVCVLNFNKHGMQVSDGYVLIVFSLGEVPDNTTSKTRMLLVITSLLVLSR